MYGIGLQDLPPVSIIRNAEGKKAKKQSLFQEQIHHNICPFLKTLLNVWPIGLFIVTFSVE